MLGRPPYMPCTEKTSCRGPERAHRENKTDRWEIETRVGEGNKKGRRVNLLKKLYCSNPRKSSIQRLNLTQNQRVKETQVFLGLPDPVEQPKMTKYHMVTENFDQPSFNINRLLNISCCNNAIETDSFPGRNMKMVRRSLLCTNSFIPIKTTFSFSHVFQIIHDMINLILKCGLKLHNK